MLLETKRLIIRPWTHEDANHYRALSTDVGYNCFSPPGYFLIKDEADLKNKIQSRIELFEKSKFCKFLVFEKQSGEFLGTCGSDFIKVDGKQEVELAYRFMLKHWGKGFATESATEVLHYLFNKLSLPRVYGLALEQNKNSCHVLQKLGFKYEKQINWFNILHMLYKNENTLNR